MVTEWHSYVNKFDEMLAEALLICARNSLNNVYCALRSEGDINPAPIIIMSIDIEEKEITLKPSMATVESLMMSMRDRIHSSLVAIPRIAEKLDLPLELRGKPFAQMMKNDAIVLDIQEKISLEVDYNKEEIDKFVSCWAIYNDIWVCSEDTFTRRIEETDQTADIFEDSIESYSNQAEMVAMKDPIVNVYFIMVNQTALKNTMMDYIEMWQLLNIKLLTSRASSKIKSK